MTKKFVWGGAALLALGTTACGGALAGGTLNNPVRTPSTVRTVAVVVRGVGGPLTGAACALEDIAGFGPHQGVTDANGYVAWNGVAASLTDTAIHCTAPGYVPLDRSAVLTTSGNEDLPPVTMGADHVDPSSIPLEQLAAIRGAMWPLGTAARCGALPLGPRPGQADNVIATDFITDYTPAEQDCIIAELKARGYTHVVMGPLVDSDGYHGIWPPNDWRGANWDRFLDAHQKFWDAGLAVVTFGKPDGWTLEQLQTFTDLLQHPRAQRLIRIFVPMGWEAGANYEYSSCTWAEAGRWAHAVLPHALLLVHMVADRDAPAGTDARCNDDDKVWNPGGNAAAWARVTPFYHGWLTQSAAFENPTQTGGDREHPDLTNFQNWQRLFDPAVRGSYRDRFEHRYAGWPTGSAWGVDQPLLVYAGEYAAYWKFWQHRTEAEGVAWGDRAMAHGAAGYLDSGSVPVPRPR